jgi:hypothetical protein
MGGWVGLRVGFIYINDMYNNDVGKGGRGLRILDLRRGLRRLLCNRYC